MSVSEAMVEPIRIELPTPFSVGGVNTYLFKSPEPVLIDCGMNTADSQNALVEGLKAEGLSIRDIKKVIITHAHVDHVGAAPWIVANSDAEIWVSNLVYDWAINLEEMWESRMVFVENMLRLSAIPEENLQRYVTYMRMVPSMWGSIPVERTKRFPIEGMLSFGGRDWQTMYAPGHTYTQSCFYHADSGALLSADMILPIVPVPVIEQPGPDRDERTKGLPQYLVSLERFASLEVSTVYPGHGAPFREHRAVLKQQRGRIDNRMNECLELVRAGHVTVYELAEKMYAHYPAVARMTGVSMVIGYLDLLLEKNLVKRDVVGECWHFTPTIS